MLALVVVSQTDTPDKSPLDGVPSHTPHIAHVSGAAIELFDMAQNKSALARVLWRIWIDQRWSCLAMLASSTAQYQYKPIQSLSITPTPTPVVSAL